MSSAGPLIGKEDTFEGLYTAKFRALVKGEGEFVNYEKDRVALDVGLHLTTPSGQQRRVSHTRIWFQLKGIHSTTLPLQEYQGAADAAVVVSLNHLKFWFASPEPVYLAVYVESADCFLAEDVREIVHRQWGADFLTPDRFPEGQSEVTVRVRTDSTLTPDRLVHMRRHQSMRIDGPFFRGRPLGHRLDPLRCSPEELEPLTYALLVQRLLEVHDYRPGESLSLGVLFPGHSLPNEHASLSVGRLHNTFEWVPQLFTEFGTAPADDFRIEGTPEFAHGPVAVFIHGDPRSGPTAGSCQALAQTLLKKSVYRILVFANTEDQAYFGAFFGGFLNSGVACMPQLLGDLAYSIPHRYCRVPRVS